MSYDSEALLALRKAVEEKVERELLKGGSDNVTLVLITPYLLFHVLDELREIREAIQKESEV